MSVPGRGVNPDLVEMTIGGCGGESRLKKPGSLIYIVHRLSQASRYRPEPQEDRRCRAAQVIACWRSVPSGRNRWIPSTNPCWCCGRESD